MFWPALTEAGPVLVMARLACGPTFVVTLAGLFELSGSATELETVALLVILPVVSGAVIAIVSVGSVPLPARGPGCVQVMVEPTGAPQLQPLPQPPAPGTAPGSVSGRV